ncbi:MAG TPA: DsbA family protein [Gemmatimonadales bacterium]|nr:DsbA family protein [Gemmatimonadales bacterium]
MTTLTIPVGPQDHITGPATAPIILVEYGDFQCPYCREAYPIVKQVQEQLGDRLRFAFRNFPLTRIHQNAQHAAEAAEAAAAQGAFWQMHDRLFERQFALEDENLLEYARELGLNADRLAGELAAGTYRARVRDHFMSGVKSGVNGTPTFFINGTRHDGSYDLATLLGALEASRSSSRS